MNNSHYEVTANIGSNEYTWHFGEEHSVRDSDGRESHSTTCIKEARRAVKMMNKECRHACAYSGAKITKVTPVFDENGDYEDENYEVIS